MSYITVVTLQDAKDYLRVDQGFTDDDAQITRMINGALSFVERWANIYVFARDITYLMVDGKVSVYDYPINSIIGPLPITDIVTERLTLYNNYCLGSDTVDLILNIGHVLPVDVPDDLREVALEIIDLMYHGSKNAAGESITEMLSMLSIDILNKHKRFLI